MTRKAFWAWSTRRQSDGVAVEHYKTLRLSDGVCVGEATIERDAWGGLLWRPIWGDPVCHDPASDPAVAFVGVPTVSNSHNYLEG